MQRMFDIIHFGSVRIVTSMKSQHRLLILPIIESSFLSNPVQHDVCIILQLLCDKIFHIIGSTKVYPLPYPHSHGINPDGSAGSPSNVINLMVGVVLKCMVC